MKPIIIGVSGKALSGKSYLVNELIKALEKENIKAAQFSIAAPLKSAIITLLGFAPDKYKFRQFYQELGDPIRKYFGNGYLATYAWLRLQLFLGVNPEIQVVIFDDLRLPEEIEVLEPHILIRLEVPREVRYKRLKNINPEYELTGEEHETETALDDYDNWDFIFRNESQVKHGIKEVVQKIKALL